MSNEDFVKAWAQAVREGRNQSWLAERFQVSRQYISQKAVYLRKKGVKLPKMSRSLMKPLNVDALNALLEPQDERTP